MNPARPDCSTYDPDRLLNYEIVPSRFLTYFSVVLKILIYLLIPTNLFLFLVQLFLENIEFIIMYCSAFIIISHVCGEMYNNEGRDPTYYRISSAILSIGLIIIPLHLLFIPPKTIFNLLCLIVLFVQDVSTFLFMYINANWWCVTVKPYAPLENLILSERAIRGDPSVQVIRCKANEIILKNTMDTKIDLSFAVIEKCKYSSIKDWKIRLPERTIIKANAFIQIVPWRQEDQKLCEVGLRHHMEHLFYPRTKTTFFQPEEDYTRVTLIRTDGKHSILEEIWIETYCNRNYPNVFYY